MIEHENVGGVAVLRLAHGKVNALDVELLDAITAAFTDAAEDPDARAVVITGAGRAFSAGVDLFRVLDGGSTYTDRLVPAISRMAEKVFTFPKPAVAAINGPAIAGGCVLACACDRRVLAPGAAIGATELRVGVAFPAAALEILSYAAGTAAEDVILTAGLYRDDAAIRTGLAHELAEDPVARAVEVAADLVTTPYGMTKSALRAPTLARIRAANDDAVRANWASAETAAAIRASLERTTGVNR